MSDATTPIVGRLHRPGILGRPIPARSPSRDPAAPIGGFCPVCGRSYTFDPQRLTTCPRDGSVIEGAELSCVWLG